MLKHIFQIVSLLTQLVVLLKPFLEGNRLDEIVSLLQRIYDSLLVAGGHPPAIAPQRQPPAQAAKSKYLYTYKDGTEAPFAEDELMTLREALAFLRMSADKLLELRNADKIISLYHKRNVRLIKTDVEAAFKVYTLMRK